MKITICGSVRFRKEMVEVRDQLNKMGHKGIICPVMEDLALGRNPELMKRIKEDHGQVKRKEGYIKWYYKAIADSNAILVLNYDKDGIKNYIGGNTLMEMGFAHVKDKKVFLLNPIPEKVSYTDEIKAVTDVILNGNFNRMK